MYGLLSVQTSYPNVNVGDVKFYLIASILVIVLFVMSFLFSKTKKFKMRKREEIKSQKDVYVNPRIIRVKKTDIDKELYDAATKDEPKGAKRGAQ